MSAKRVFLEKKFRDCRFRRYEDRIIDAYLANYNKDLTAMSLAKKAKTSRRQFMSIITQLERLFQTIVDICCIVMILR